MSDSRYHHFQRGETPAQFFLQVEEGMARFDVPDAANLSTLLEYSRSNGYQVEWTDKIRNEELGDLDGFPGGRYVAHRLPENVLEPGWQLPAPPEGVAN
jgi:hypothetical protein